MSTITGGDIIAIVTGGVVESTLITVPAADVSGDTVLDKKILPIVEKTIKKYGKVLTYTVESSSSHSAATGQVVVASDDVNKVSIPPYKPDLKYINGDLVKQDDYFSGVAAKDLTFIPVRGMIVLFDSTKYKILRLVPIYSGNQIALFLFQLRK